MAEAVCKRWPDHGSKWLGQVHDELADLCKRYGAKPVKVMRARYGFVVAVDSRHGPLIMRSSPDPDGANQAKVSVALADLGVSPKIHKFVETDFGTWTVTDRVLPGIPIGDLGGRVDLASMAAMLQPMVEQPAPAPNLPSLVGWLRDRLTDPHLDDLPIGRSPAPQSERCQALDALDYLAADCPAELCHGDASPWNILAGENSRLWLVDPRGMVGEVAYDIAVIAIKGADHVAPMFGASLLAKRAGVDPQRARSWVAIASAARV